MIYPWIERAVLESGRLRVDDAASWENYKRVIFVCTGNICRSPYAEAVARSHGLESISCGVATRTGLPADPTAQEEAAANGVDLRSHLTTRWEDVDLKPGDLIIAMELRHARAVLPKARSASCTVILLSSLLPRFAVIWDPYGRPNSDFRNVYYLIDSAVRRLARRLAPRTSVRHHGHHHSSSYRRDSFSARVGRLLKDVIGRILVPLGIHRLLLRRHAIVAAFHSITREPSDGALRCSVDDFERYCRFFSRHLKVQTLTEIVEHLEQKRRVGSATAITFDDGYADNAELALPVLTQLGLKATFFISTGLMGATTQMPWDQSARIRSRWMTWEQVQQLIDAGHEMGAHTESHADLGALSAEEAEGELCKSRDTLFFHTGEVPRHFALPFGRAFPALEQVVRKVRDLGFSSFSLCRGGVVPQGTDPMHIERWPISPTDYLSPYGWIVDVLREVGTTK